MAESAIRKHNTCGGKAVGNESGHASPTLIRTFTPDFFWDLGFGDPSIDKISKTVSKKNDVASTTNAAKQRPDFGCKDT